MDFELPPNVSVHKQPQPKGLSYPLKTSEIVLALELAKLDVKFSIFYMNSKPESTRPSNQKRVLPSDHFNLFSLSWYGRSKDADDHHFHMGVHLVRPKYRLRVNKILREEVLPVVARWFKENNGQPFSNLISCDYHRIWRPMERHEQKYEYGIEVRENKDTSLFVKIIDLEKPEDGDSEGPVLED